MENTVFTPSELLNRKVVIVPAQKVVWSKFLRFNKCNYTIVPNKNISGQLVDLSKEEQEWLEESLKYQKGTLDRNSDFWKNYAVRLPDSGKELKLQIPAHYLEYKVLTKSPSVASGKKLNPKADWNMRDFESEAVEDNSKIKDKIKAYKAFEDMSKEDYVKLLKLYGKFTDSLSDPRIENLVSEIVDSDPVGFLATWNDKYKNTKLVFADGLFYGAINKRSGMFWFGDHQLGVTIEDASSFLSDKKNSELVIAIKAQIELNRKER